MDGLGVFAIIFLVFMSIFVFLGALDLLGEKKRKAMWYELVGKLLDVLTKNTKE